MTWRAMSDRPYLKDAPWLSSKATAGRILNMTGFNIARSPFLSCAWSPAAAPGLPLYYAPAMPPPPPRRQQCDHLKVGPRTHCPPRHTTCPDPRYFQRLRVSVCESRIPRLAGRADRSFSGPS